MDKKITIGFDAKRIVRNRTGLGAYGRTLVNDLTDRNQGQWDLRLYAPDQGADDLRQQIRLTEDTRFVYPEGTPNRLRRDFWRMKGIVGQLKKDGVDLYHGLTGELPCGLAKAGIKGVVTIHDLIFMRHPEYYHWIDTQIYQWKFRVACKEAQRIIAISECTKRDIMELGGVDEDRIDVVYQSCNPRYSQPLSHDRLQATADAYRLPKRFMLSVGTIEQRKNLMLAMNALALLPEDIHLVAVGRQTAYAGQVAREARKKGLSGRLHLLSGISDTHLQAIYQMAEVFVYPSRYEGFGIPVIEAIFSGLPVVACSGSCLEEAGGPHNLYVAPDDTEGMAQAVRLMMKGAPGREQRIAGSLEYVQRFRGTDTAAEVAGIYEKTLRDDPKKRQ